MGRGRLRCSSCCAPLPSHLESSLLTPPSPCKAVSLSVSTRNGAWGKPQTCAVPSWQPQSPCWSQQPLRPPHLLLRCCHWFYPPSAAAWWRVGVPPKTTAARKQNGPQPCRWNGHKPQRVALRRALSGVARSVPRDDMEGKKVSEVLEVFPVGNPCTCPLLGRKGEKGRTKPVSGAFSQKCSTLGSLSMDFTGLVISEDCPNLNIWAYDYASPYFHMHCTAVLSVAGCSMNNTSYQLQVD